MKIKQSVGQGMVEYALILLLIAIGLLIVLQLMGVSVSDVFCRVSAGFAPGLCGATNTAYCVDNFSVQNQLKQPSGQMTSGNGNACITGGVTTLNACSTNTMTASDYTAQIDGAMLTRGNGYGIFFRASDNGLGVNGYAFQYDPGASGFVIRKWVNGREIYPTLAYQSAPAYNWLGGAHTLSVKVVGNSFTGMVDGNAVLSGKDSTYTSGGAGIRTWDALTNFCMNSFSVNPNAP